MTDRELMQQALEALEDVDAVPYERVHVITAALRERLAQPDAYGYTSRLAVAIWEKHYKDAAPQWKPLDDLMGVLTQIDNMTSGLTRLAQPEQEPETVMAEYKFQTYAAYKTPDGEMKIGVVPDDAPLTLNGVPLYPRREWVGLTQEDWLALGCKTSEEIRVGLDVAAKLKEKNNGTR